MYRKIIISGVTAAAIVGAGGAALAATGSDTIAGSAATTHSQADHGKRGHGKHGDRRGQRLLRHLDHAEIVVHTKKHGFVTRQLIRGTVSSVSSTSITVTSADHATDTFTVNGKTVVRKADDGKRTKSSISAVQQGDHVFVGGVGATTPVARQIIDRGTSTK